MHAMTANGGHTWGGNIRAYADAAKPRVVQQTLRDGENLQRVLQERSSLDSVLGLHNRIVEQSESSVDAALRFCNARQAGTCILELDVRAVHALRRRRCDGGLRWMPVLECSGQGKELLRKEGRGELRTLCNDRRLFLRCCHTERD